MIDARTEPSIDKLRSFALVLLSENERLQRLISNLTEQLGKATGADASQLQQQILFMQEQLRSTRDALYGRSSEKRSRKPADSEDREERKPTGHGPTDQPSLPIEEKVHVLDDPDKVCPECGKKLAPIEGMFEESDEVTVAKIEFRVIRHQRQKYRCSGCSHMETALGPEKLIPGGRYSVEFASHVAIGKYADHLPLERQVQQMARAGLQVTGQALWDQIEAQARFLEPTYDALGDYVRMAPVIGLDDTRWPVSPREQERQTWNVWTITRPDAVFHHIDPSRSANAAALVVKDFRGIVMADGYKAHDSLLKLLTAQPGKPPFDLVQCWAHARRKFVAAQKDYPAADVILDLIADLYQVEKEARLAPPDAWPGVLAELRATKSAPLLERIHEWLTTTQALPGSSLGKAIKYAWGHWDRLKKFLTNPLIPLDNNATERALRALVVGRKNYYGSRSRRGTEVAAIYYSLIESAKLVGLDPAVYLSQVTRRAILDKKAAYLPVQMVADLAEQASQVEEAAPIADQPTV